MKKLLQAGISAIIGAAIGLGIIKLMQICFDFIYNHFGDTGSYIAIFVCSVVVGTIANYVIHDKS